MGEPQTARNEEQRLAPVRVFAIASQIPENAKTCRMLCADGNSKYTHTDKRKG